MIDVAELRAATPGVGHVVHLNNAGAALVSRATLDRTLAHLRREADIGAYEAAAEAESDLAETHRSLAQLVGVRSEEVALVDGASRAFAALLSGIPLAPGDRVVTARSEYGSNVVSLHQRARRDGFEIAVAPDGADGTVDVEALAGLVDDRTRLVTITHAPGTNGLVQPVAEIGRHLADHPACFVVDASQSLGQLPVDLPAIGCDALIGTSRKFLRGPRGVGIVVVRAETAARLDPTFVELASARRIDETTVELVGGAARFAAWEGAIAARLGLGVAVDELATIGADAVRSRIDELARRLRHGVAEIDGVTVHDRGTVRSGIVTFSSSRAPSPAIVDALRAASINTSVSVRASSPLDPVPGAWEHVRASVHAYNLEDEIDRAVAVVADHVS